MCATASLPCEWLLRMLIQTNADHIYFFLTVSIIAGVRSSGVEHLARVLSSLFCCSYKHHDLQQHGEARVYLAYRLQATIEESRKLKQSGRCLPAFFPWPSQPAFHIAQAYLSRGGTTHSAPGPYINQQSRKHIRDTPTGQSDGGSPSVQVPSRYVWLLVKFTKVNQCG